jgi:hypothetical protein
MSLETTLARIELLRGALAPRAATATATPAGGDGFRAQLLGAGEATGVPFPVAAPPAGSGPAAAVAAAAGEVGQAEQPPGSNDSPRIATYRQATAGSGVGPWCAYFVSWAARQAGVPLGEAGQGFGSVDALYAWAQRTGRATPAGPGVTPGAGDLIVFNEHVGIVEGVDPDGTIHTIEGNSSDAVSRRTYPPGGGGALGYVRLG